jgi:hypothetical protein
LRGAAWLAAWWRRPDERHALLGVLAFLLGLGCVVGAVTWGRAEYVTTAGFILRYGTLLLPLGCCLYFLWERYGGARGAPAAQMALFLLVSVMVALNVRAAWENGHARRAALRAFAADLTARVPPALLAKRGAGPLYWADGREDLARYIRMLRDTRTAAFGRLPADAPRVAVLPVSACTLCDMTWADGVARPLGGDPALEFALPRAEYVCAIRLRYTYTNAPGSPDQFEFRVPGLKMFALRLAAVELLLPEQTDSSRGAEAEGR